MIFLFRQLKHQYPAGLWIHATVAKHQAALLHKMVGWQAAVNERETAVLGHMLDNREKKLYIMFAMFSLHILIKQLL